MLGGMRPLEGEPVAHCRLELQQLQQRVGPHDEARLRFEHKLECEPRLDVVAQVRELDAEVAENPRACKRIAGEPERFVVGEEGYDTVALQPQHRSEVGIRGAPNLLKPGRGLVGDYRLHCLA
jgi:hypothetical protein